MLDSLDTPGIGKVVIQMSSANSIMSYIELDLNIYPNPFTGRLYINGIQNASYRFYNLIGKLVAEGTTNGIIQTTSILSSGVYFLEIVEGNQRFRKEVVKF